MELSLLFVILTCILMLITCAYLILLVSRIEDEARTIVESTNLIIRKLNAKPYHRTSDNPYQE